jgi:polyisoprenoid-binding protein YceI
LILFAIWLTPALASAQSAARDSVVYLISPASRLEVRTGSAGLFSFAGHEHVIRARAFSGRVVYHADAPAASRVEVTVLTDSLEVLTPPDTVEIRKVTAAMRTEVLDVARYPEIRFVSRTVARSGAGLSVVGALTLVGRTRAVPVDVGLAVRADTLRATATFAVKQSDFGITPYRGGPAGTVRVADLVRFQILAVAVRQAGRSNP